MQAPSTENCLADSDAQHHFHLQPLIAEPLLTWSLEDSAGRLIRLRRKFVILLVGGFDFISEAVLLHVKPKSCSHSPPGACPETEPPALPGVAPLIPTHLGEFLFRVERSNLAEAGG
jgi:hypothetical protein